MKQATTPIAREEQLINLATDLAEKQLADGTASAQVITHYLKLATQRSKVEDAKLELEMEQIKARTAMINTEVNRETLASDAISAMKSYQGISDEDLY